MNKYEIKFGLFDKVETVFLEADDRDHAIALARLELKKRGVKYWNAEGIRAFTAWEEKP